MEIVYHMKCKTKGKFGEISLKIDPKMDSKYLLAILLKLDFDPKMGWMG